MAAEEGKNSGILTPAVDIPGTQLNEDPPPDTPPQIKRLMGGIEMMLDTRFATQNNILEITRKENEGNFQLIKSEINTVSNKVRVVEKSVANVSAEQTKLATELHKTNSCVITNRKVISNLVAEQDSVRNELEDFKSRVTLLSEKMANIDDIHAQYRAGKLGPYHPGDSEEPTRKDIYDAKVAFNKSRHGIGIKPVYQDQLDLFISRGMCSNMVDAYRIAFSEFLQLEMGFTEEFVRNLEEHVVEIVYNNRDTVFFIFDNIMTSGAQRINQESHILWKRQTGSVHDPSIEKLDIPQYRSRHEAFKTWSNELRWDWRKKNPQLYEAGQRCRTRVEISYDNQYDFVVQCKLPGEKYVNLTWPEDRVLPKVNWKVKNYVNHLEIATYPKSLDKIKKKDFNPQGRQSLTDSIRKKFEKQPKRYVPVTTHTLRESHDFVPGMMDPGNGNYVTLNEASGVTSERIHASGPRSTTAHVGPVEEHQMFTEGTGVGAGCYSFGMPKTNAEEAEARRRGHEKSKILQGPGMSRDDDEVERRERERLDKEEKGKLEAAQQSSTQQSSWFRTLFGGFLSSNTDGIQDVTSTSASVISSDRTMDLETPENTASLEADIEEIAASTRRDEGERWAEDMRRKREEEIARAAEEELMRRTVRKSGRGQGKLFPDPDEDEHLFNNLSTSHDREDAQLAGDATLGQWDNLSQMSEFTQPPSLRRPETIIAQQKLRPIPMQTTLSQVSESSFLTKPSSTMTPSKYEEESDSDFSTPNNDDEDPDRTLSLHIGNSPVLNKSLNFVDKYRLCKVTPQGKTPGQEKVNVIPSGAEENETGATMTLPKLPNFSSNDDAIAKFNARFVTSRKISTPEEKKKRRSVLASKVSSKDKNSKTKLKQSSLHQIAMANAKSNSKSLKRKGSAEKKKTAAKISKTDEEKKEEKPESAKSVQQDEVKVTEVDDKEVINEETEKMNEGEERDTVRPDESGSSEVETESEYETSEETEESEVNTSLFNTLDETILAAQNNDVIGEDGIKTIGTTDTDSSLDVVIETEKTLDSAPEGEEPLKEEVNEEESQRHEINREYDDNHVSPDKKQTPPRDNSGHIAGVQGSEEGMVTNSDECGKELLTTAERRRLESTDLEDLVSTAEKKILGREVD